MEKQKLIGEIIECENVIKRLPKSDINVLKIFSTEELIQIRNEYKKLIVQLGNVANLNIKIADKHLDKKVENIISILLKL